ncbi:hypothetical protein GA0070558_15610 [Micromonospora haikouensis]|uniref:Uncharacterized protein n=1 Tax=Micromonospora haikouensis TaxID=686309 RepID=A0A1C4YNF0_9ACTN|nr:hypothetical protein [Micromonospora haikouensis]SCF21861.1 hypothetical protein GA0070558_15610 [Micromonospora haikouensis]
MTTEESTTPVVVIDGEPWEVIGRAGRAKLLVVLVRCGRLSTILGLHPDVLTVMGHITWTTGSNDHVGEVKDTWVREDRTERGVGVVLCRAARKLVGVDVWTGLAIPDSEDRVCSLQDADAISRRQPDPIVDLVDGSSTAAEEEVHVVFHREGSAVVVAFKANTLAWIGHLAWTIIRPGGRLDGLEAGLTVGEVKRVDTREGFRKSGVADRMYRRAREAAAGQGWPVEVDHNPDRTVSGDRWAMKVGGWRPALSCGRHIPDFNGFVRSH